MSEAIPIVNILSEVELLNLSAMTKHPGFSALEKLHMALCDHINKKLLKLDMSSEGYERELKALHLKAQVYNEFSLLILRSCFWQAETEKVKEDLELTQKKPNETPMKQRISGENPILQRIMQNYDRDNTINAGNDNN